MKSPGYFGGLFIYIRLVFADFSQNRITSNKNIPEMMVAIILSSVLLFAISAAGDVKILAVSAVELTDRMLNKIASGFHLLGLRLIF
jgi:hypothetical protein